MTLSPEQLAPRLRLHVLTDREWSRGRSTLAVAEAAIAGGATVIQLRDKTASTRLLVEEGLALRELTRKYDVLLIVNDRIDVALAVDADGISLAHAHIGLLSVGLDRTRAEQQELHEVPPVKRQFVHLTLGYELRYGC